MSNDRARVRRLRLLVGILAGVFVGSAHALVSHSLEVRGPAGPAAFNEAGQSGLVVLDSSGTLLLVVVDDAESSRPAVATGLPSARRQAASDDRTR